MPTKPKINREILKWARTSGRISLEKAAKTISKTVTADRIKEWETPDGKESPSLAQLKKLARLYRRSVDIFSLPYIPKEFPRLKDFRSNKDDLDTAVIFIMREIQEKQEWLSNLKHLTKGIEKANSWSVDGHKTLNTPYDCGIILCEDREAISSALHMTGSYIVVGKERDGMYYTPDMSQRARAIELWAILKYLGRKGIEQLVYEMHQRAVQFAEELKSVQGFTVLNDVVFNQVLVCCETDDITDKTISKIQELRECWVGGSTWQGKRVIRISVCSWATTADDVDQSANSFRKALSAVMNEVRSAMC